MRGSNQAQGYIFCVAPRQALVVNVGCGGVSRQGDGVVRSLGNAVKKRPLNVYVRLISGRVAYDIKTTRMHQHYVSLC